MSGQANTNANRCDSYEKHLVNLKGTTTVVDPAKVRRTLKHVRSMGVHADRARSKKLLNKKQNVSRDVIRDRESTNKKCALTRDFSYELRILSDLITKYCCESRNDRLVSETTMSVERESVLTRAIKLTGIE